MSDTASDFEHGLTLYQQGRLADAERIWLAILRARPDHADAAHALGVIALRTGRPDRAIERFAAVIAQRPDHAEAHANLGNALRALGRHQDALASYDRAIAAQPDHPEAHYNRANALRDLGRPEAALAGYDAAIAARPDFAEAHFNRGNVLRALHRPEQAIASYDTAIALRPNDGAEALGNRGNALLHLHRYDAAIDSYRRAIGLKPNSAELHYNLANARRAAGRHAEALAGYDNAIALKPEHAEAWLNRGNALADLGRHAEAVASHDQAIALKPDFAEAYYNRGNALKQQAQRAGDLSETWFEHGNAMRDRRRELALENYDRAIAARPDHAAAHNNRGAVLTQLGRFEEAVHSFDAAIALRPDDADVYNNRGNALACIGRHTAALESFDRALALQPDAPETMLNQSLCHLALGDYASGWLLFEHRWRAGLARPSIAVPGPAWLGDFPIDGKTILLRAEQGHGDTLQFCRYVPMLAERAEVVLEVQPALIRLLSGLPGLPGVRRIVAAGDPLPPFDAWTPLLSLPLAFGTTLATIPADVPYLYADTERSADWRRRLAALPGRKIGLVWAGSPWTGDPNANAADQRRSMTLGGFAPLSGIPGLTLISLQKGAPAAQARTLPANMTLHDWTDELTDFADTAALVAALDLVISVDTSVVHLAGALGVPVWVLNRYDQCWRWLRDRDDSPWYPTARLFRQRTPGDWAGVIADVAAALRDQGSG